MAVPRQQEIRRRQHRRRKLARLRARYAAARTAEERAEILERVRRIAPSVRLEVFMAQATALAARRG